MVASGTQLIPAPAPPQPRPLVAPLWHTALILFLLLAPWDYRLFPSGSADFFREHRPILYILQLQFQWLLFLIMILGLMARRTRLADLIGNRWKDGSDFFRDLGLGLAIMALNCLIGLLIVLVVQPTHQAPQHAIDPHTMGQLAGFIPIALTAGFTEEAIFRGYLQRQLLALTGNPVIAIAGQAAIFSLGHGFTLPVYDLAAKFIAGILFGAIAFRRKSLLPGMLGHAAQDCFAGLVAVAIS
jgi:uncharacterized protein